jgi:V8-like Glu-specific endopeptidase
MIKQTMKFIPLILVILVNTAIANTKVVYGKDNRKEYYQVNSFLRNLADSTAAMVENKIIDASYDSYNIYTQSTHGQEARLCEGEKFAEQSQASFCSGFLVGEDTLVTAGHCFKTLQSYGYTDEEAVCEGFSWIFDHKIEKNGQSKLRGINANSVYKCKSVVKAVFEPSMNMDFAVIKLDRKVLNRRPLTYRSTGKLADKTQLVVIGHPSRLPMKIAAGGTILANRKANSFTTSLDTFHGNSGSAVFNARTGVIEGILVSGKADYVKISDGKGGSCNVVNVCDMNGANCMDGEGFGPAGEEVTRITLLTKYLK